MTDVSTSLSIHRLTKKYDLIDITDHLFPREEIYWKINFLAETDNKGDLKSTVLEEFMKWRTEKPTEFKKILRSIEYGATHKIHNNPELIDKDENGLDVYEFRKSKCRYRLMFFKDERTDSLIICTNTFLKGPKKKLQNKAFQKCERKRREYFAET